MYACLAYCLKGPAMSYSQKVLSTPAQPKSSILETVNLEDASAIKSHLEIISRALHSSSIDSNNVINHHIKLLKTKYSLKAIENIEAKLEDRHLTKNPENRTKKIKEIRSFIAQEWKELSRANPHIPALSL